MIIEIINHFIRLLTYFKLLHTRQLQLNLSSGYFVIEVYTPPTWYLTIFTIVIIYQKFKCSKKGSYIIIFVLCKMFQSIKQQ